MRPIRLTIILLVIALLLLVVPIIRTSVFDTIGAMRQGDTVLPTTDDIRELQETHADDGEVWLGIAEATASSPTQDEIRSGAEMALPKGDPEKAFAQAIELQPSSPAPHMRYAVYHLVNAGKLGRAEAAGFEGVVPFRDTAQITHLRQAHDLLVTCRELDPDNAACDYWLAWTLFAQKRDTEAFTIIHEALSKDHWDDYHAEAVAAVFRVNDATNLPPMVSAIATSALLAGHDFPIHSSTRSLARLLVGLGDRFRSQDLDENAVLCYRACAQIGYVIRTDAKTTIEGLVGIAVSAIASTSFVTPGEREQVAAQFANTEERIAKVREAKLTRFTRYMNQQGESEFAAWYAADLDEGDLWKADASLAARGMVPWLIRSLTRGGILNGAAVGMNLVVMLSVAGLVWLASLVAAAWKEPKQTNLWSHATWAILLLVCLLPGQIAAFIAAGMIDADTESNMVVASVLTSITPVVGVVIWLVAVIVVALRRRESEPWESRLIKPRAVLSGLRAMILPTLAALLLAGLIATVPVSRAFRDMDAQQREMMQDEVKFWGIGPQD